MPLFLRLGADGEGQKDTHVLVCCCCCAGVLGQMLKDFLGHDHYISGMEVMLIQLKLHVQGGARGCKVVQGVQ